MVNEQRRVVVTGMGIVASNGIGKKAFTEAMFEGKSGVTEIDLFDAKDYRIDRAAYIKEVKKIESDERKDRVYQILDIACSELMESSNIDFLKENLEEIGVSLGTCLGNVDCIDKYIRSKVNQDKNNNVGEIIDQPHINLAIYIANKYNLKNVVSVVDTACASGTNAIGYALDRIKFGDAQVMVAGGVDPFSRLSQSGFGGLKSLSVNKTRPFTKDRNGLILGEGGGLILLEELNHAIARNATIYAEIIGYGLSNDAYHETTPDPNGGGAELAIRNCILDAEISYDRVSYINAHGTGTVFNDAMELKAIQNVFKDRAKEIPISTIKPLVGHTLGAAGSIELVAAILSLTHDKIPATINFTEAMEGYKEFDFVQNTSREEGNLDVILSNSFAFGGNGACIAVAKYKE